jgi:hypothetical protein
MVLENVCPDFIGGGVELDAVGHVDGSEQRFLAAPDELLQLELVAGAHQIEQEVLAVGGGRRRRQLHLVRVDPPQETAANILVEYSPV